VNSVSSQKCYTAAVGYLELGMAEDAALELSRLSDEEKRLTEVFQLSCEIHMVTKSWVEMEEVARELSVRSPNDPEVLVSLAYATRRCRDINEAEHILLAAVEKYPEHPLVQYNLGCYAAQLGRLDEALSRVKKAISFDHAFEAMALSDSDLELIRDSLRKS